MTTQTSNWLLRQKWILAAMSLPALIALWWAFRPEKLWINESVNEPAPFATSADPQPILTGRFEGDGRQTSGRATIYKKADREYLRLTDFTTMSGADVHVALARSEDIARDGVGSVDCGSVKSNQGDQNYDLPAGTDAGMYKAVIIYAQRSRAVYGAAKLEPF